MPGKAKGTKNYKKDLLLKAVKKVLPVSTEDWAVVLEKYRKYSNDNSNRSAEDVKRYFWEGLCKKGVKPTGKSAPDELTGKAQDTYRKILDKQNSQTYCGDSGSEGSSDSEDAEDGDDYDEDDSSIEENAENSEVNAGENTGETQQAATNSSAEATATNSSTTATEKPNSMLSCERFILDPK